MQIETTAVYNHAISAKKFRIIEAILQLGWNVLLSDIDVLVLKASPIEFSSLWVLSFPGNLPRRTRMHRCLLPLAALEEALGYHQAYYYPDLLPAMQNPFKHLHRDHDYEGMTDG